MRNQASSVKFVSDKFDDFGKQLKEVLTNIKKFKKKINC